MALTKTIELKGKQFLQTEQSTIDLGTDSITIKPVIRVSSISGGKESVVAIVTFIADNVSYSKQYTIPMSTEDGSVNFIKQAYEHLKTLSEFSDAKDC